MNSLRQKSFSIIVYFFAFSLVGLCLVPLLPIKLNPEKSLPQLHVAFSMNGQAPRTVESEATSRLESMLSLIGGVRSIQSSSYNGGGAITLLLDEGANVDAVRFEVATIVRQTWTQLPKEVSYPFIFTASSADGAGLPFLTYRIIAPASPNVICDYANKHILPRLVRLEGVSDVILSGRRPKEFVLEYDKQHLDRLGITDTDLRQALWDALNSTYLGMGVWKEDDGRFLCPVSLKSGQADSIDISKINVKVSGGKIVRLDELVTVVYQEQLPQSFFRINGMQVTTLSVHASPEANQITLSRKVSREMERLSLNMPSGFELHKDYDASEYIQKEIKYVGVRAGVSILILLCFVLLVSRSFRYLLVIVLSLSANLSIAFTCYYVLGVELQLYSLAGITISLGLAIDNLIVMADHLAHRQQIGVFRAILASTLTTVSSLAMVFLLDGRTRLNLQDFAIVVIVNLLVSLAVSFFLLPALLARVHYHDSSPNGPKGKRRIVLFNNFYASFLIFCTRFRKWLYVGAFFVFGAPIFLLPTRLEGDTFMTNIYNATRNSQAFSLVERILGGTLRLFVKRPMSEFGVSERGETRLEVRAYLPYGATLDEMNETVKRMEAYVSKYRGVKQFQTQIYSPQFASIFVLFTKFAEKSGVPHKMKSDLVGKAVKLGNATWSIFGVGDGFNNRLFPSQAEFCVEMRGYNYDELMNQAVALREKLMEHRRIRDVKILPAPDGRGRDNEEYLLSSNPEELAKRGLNVRHLYSSLLPIMDRNSVGGYVWVGQEYVPVRLQSLQAKQYGVWDVKNGFQTFSGVPYRLSQMASVIRQQIPQHISKTDQQYLLYLEFDYVGYQNQGYDILKEILDQYRKDAPMGYHAQKKGYEEVEDSDSGLGKWGALAGVAFLIYAICCVLFNSFLRPLPVLLIIPFSCVGVFVSFVLFDIPLGHGGFAAFVLLSGLACNSVIYLLDDYYTLLRCGHPRSLRTYQKAFNGKIIPILLTTLSTVLGFLPFLFVSGGDAFWMSLAVGTISGLFFSLLGLCVYLPLLIGVGKRFKV